MATELEKALEALESRLNKRFDAIDSDISSLKSDVSKILKYVSHENDDIDEQLSRKHRKTA